MHALGAIKLTGGRVLAAQRLWNQAATEHPEACTSHGGMALQMEKLKCYGYLDKNQRPISEKKCSNSIASTSPIPGQLDRHTVGSIFGQFCQQQNRLEP
jgi:hypothetical protein